MKIKIRNRQGKVLFKVKSYSDKPDVIDGVNFTPYLEKLHYSSELNDEVVLDGYELINCHFFKNTHRLTVHNCRFIRCNFQHSEFNFSSINDSCFFHCSFDCSRIFRTNFRNCRLEDCSFSNTFFGGDFKDSTLLFCDFSYVYFNWSDLRWRNQLGCKFNKAVFNQCDINEEDKPNLLGEILSEPIRGWTTGFDGRYEVMVELEIPEGAIIFGTTELKRTNKVKVVSIDSVVDGVTSNGLTFKIGEEIQVDSFSLMGTDDEGGGVYFFKSYERAYADIQKPITTES